MTKAVCPRWRAGCISIWPPVRYPRKAEEAGGADQHADFGHLPSDQDAGCQSEALRRAAGGTAASSAGGSLCRGHPDSVGKAAEPDRSAGENLPLETGLLALHPKRGEIGPVVERAVSQYAPKASEKKISLTVKSTKGSGVFDPKWTEEALCNLLDNAVKYTPSGGSVTVEVREYEMFSAVQGDGYRPRHSGGGAGEDLQPLLPFSLRLAGGGRGDRPVSDQADRLRPGRLCEGEKRTGRRQHLFPLSASVRQKPRAFRRGSACRAERKFAAPGLAARPACLSVKRRGMAGKTVTKMTTLSHS